MLYKKSPEFSPLESPYPPQGGEPRGPSVPASQLSTASGSGLPGLNAGLFSCSQWPAEPPIPTLKTALLLKESRKAWSQGRRGSFLNTLQVCPTSPSDTRPGPEASRRQTPPASTSRQQKVGVSMPGLWKKLFIGQAQGPIFSFPTTHPESCI